MTHLLEHAEAAANPAVGRRGEARGTAAGPAPAIETWQAAPSGIDAAIRSLTPREARVFEYLGDGLANKTIARTLEITESTVKAHVSAILEKLGCANRTQVALISVRHVRARAE